MKSEFKCWDCNGEGIDPHDTDPMGGSMNTPCSKCDGTGLSKVGITAAKEAGRAKAVDDAWERNRSDRNIK